MDCFSNLIGIKYGCGEVQTPTSRLFLDQLTGINVANADAAINAQYADGMQLLTEKRDFAMEAVKAEVRSHIANHMQMKSIVESGVLGYPKDNLPTLAAESGYYKGIQVDLNAYPYSSFELTSVRLQAQSTGTVAISVIDLSTAKIIDTFNIETVAGELSETVVNKTYSSWNKRLNLAIVYDSTALSAYKTGISSNAKHCSTCNSGWYRDTVTARGVYFSNTGTLTQNSTRGLSHTAGLSITYNLSCDTEPFLCSLGSAMAWPILHKWGAEVVKEFQYSQRLNSIVTLNRNNHKELREEYEETYQKSMENLFKNLTLPKDICFGCKPPLRKVVQLP